MPFATVPTTFEWPAGPSSVQVSGDWDQWTDKLELKRNQDGSFKAELDLPQRTKLLFKFIVDGVWQTKPGFPTERDDSNNENNVFTTGEAAPAKGEDAIPAPSTAAKSQPIEIPDNSVPNTPAISSEAAWPAKPTPLGETLSSSPDKPVVGGLSATAAGGIAGASAGAAGIAAMFGSSPEKGSLDLVRGPGAKKADSTAPVKSVADGQVGAAPAAAATTISKAPGVVADAAGTQVTGRDALRGASVAVEANGRREEAASTAAPQVSGAPAGASKVDQAAKPAAAKVGVSGAPAGASAKDSKPLPAAANASTDSAPSGHVKGTSTAASSTTAVSTSASTAKEAGASTMNGKDKEKRGSLFGTLSRSRRKSSGLVLSEAEQAAAASDATKGKGGDVPPVPPVPQGVAGVKATVNSATHSPPSSKPVAAAPAPAPVTPKKAAPVSASKPPAAATQTPEKKSGSGFLGKLKKGLTPKKGSD